MKTLTWGFIFLSFQQIVLASDFFGMALQVNGKVSVTRDILEFDAQVEEQFMWNDEIETGEDGSMILVFDSSFLSIGPSTVMHFEKRKGENQEDLMVMVLDKGSFRSKILNLGSKQFFEVESAGGRLRVHGTDFVTSVKSEGGDNFGVSVLQGRVRVSPANNSDKSSGSSAGRNDMGSSMMLTQNKSGGYSSEGQKEVTQISFAQVDGIKAALPIPGDEKGTLVMEDFGMKNVAVENLVESIKETQKDLIAEPPVQLAPPQMVLQISFDIIDR